MEKKLKRIDGVEKDDKADPEMFVEAIENLGFKAKLRKESSR